MNQDDFLYLTVFYVVLTASYFDRKFENRLLKQVYGAVIGFCFSLVLCGTEIHLILINVAVNAWITAFSDRKKCQILSFIFTFSFLFYCRQFSLSPVTNIMLMSTTMKMVGVAFEANEEYSTNRMKNDTDVRPSSRFQSVKWKDIVFYGMNYNGLFGAPYYTYSTYEDFLELPFKYYHDWKNLCIYKLVSSSIIITLYLIVDHFWPISYTSTEDFFENERTLYRIWYVYPIAYTFTFRVWNALVLLECSCCINGLGVYPTFTKPQCGYGPTEMYDKMKSLRDEAQLIKEEYSFATIENIDILKYHSKLEFGKAIRHWNSTIQYWLYKVIYKNIPYDLLKKPATMLASSYWHGLDFGYFASLFFSSLILVVEKRWSVLLKEEVSVIFFQVTFLRVLIS
ncbi:hypothetical protein WA026_010686 [Henosepilachna vigintioctopunctata]|uniref:Lysophospholipid acyltransferase 7 n=1 Tax=Henosepilachna vigintioctopunctata TaxID=420089 RepID=A0AAW1UVM6_9CUCU